MQENTTKRIYHPLIILLYIHGMLSHEQLQEIPKTTKHNWSKFQHKHCFGFTWAESYVERFEEVQEVFSGKYLYRTLKYLTKIKRGYYTMVREVQGSKKLLQSHSSSIVESIEDMVRFSKVSVSQACKFYGISRDWFYAEKKKMLCAVSPIKVCYKLHPQQLTQKEVSVIEKLVTDVQNFGKTKTTLYYTALREGLLFCGKSTFNKYALALGYQKPKKVIHSRKIGVRASYVFEWLHVDVTFVSTLEDGLQKVAFIKDNFSKAILHYGSTDERVHSGWITGLFQQVFEEYDLYNLTQPIHILSDGGSENKGQLLEWVHQIKSPPVVQKVTAQTNDFPQSNSMSESIHSQYKTGFMHGRVSANQKQHLKDLERFVEYYNYHHFPTELYGVTPMEVVQGKLPDKALFTDSIAKAKVERIRYNQEFTGCKSTLGC